MGLRNRPKDASIKTHDQAAGVLGRTRELRPVKIFLQGASGSTRSAKQGRESPADLKWDDVSDNRAKHLSRCPQPVLQRRLECLEDPSGGRAQYREGGGSIQSGCVEIQRLLAALKACSRSRDLERGKIIHAAATESGDDSNIYVANTLVDMYAKCGSMVDARRVFDKMPWHTVVSWTALMLGYADNGQGELALDLFACMRPEGCAPNARTFVAALKACTSLAGKEEGRQVDGKIVKMGSLEKGLAVHSQAARSGCDTDIYVGNTLVDMYAKCGSMVDARTVFDKMPCHTVVSWNVLTLGYADNGQGELALDLFASMRLEGCAPNPLTFIAALQACTNLAVKEEGNQVGGKIVKIRSLEKGMAVHSQAASSGCDSDIYVENTLVDMYGNCGSMVDAHRVFDKMLCHTVVSWNALMLGYAENGQGALALELFARMRHEDCAPNARTFVAALFACASLAMKEEGKQFDGKLVKMGSLKTGLAIHSQASSTGCDSEIYVANTLVDMYAKCGSMVDARRVFDKMPCHTVVSWNALMLGYAENGEGEFALDLFVCMRSKGCAPNRLTFVAALQACASLAVKEDGTLVGGKLVKVGSVEKGLAVHSQAASRGYDADVFVGNTLVDMYAKCGSMVDARRVFDRMPCHTVVSWNALMLGYVENGQVEAALELFECMEPENCAPDARSFVAALKSCTHLAVKEEGRQVDGNLVKMGSLEKGLAIHSQAATSGYDSDIYVASTLIDMYAKCGSMVDARWVFDRMPCHNVVCWNSLMFGYAENGQGELALELFERMGPERCAPNHLTFVAVLKACTTLAVKEEGKQVDGKLLKMKSLEKGLAVHSQAASSGWDSEIYVGNTLVDMYAKCGSMVDARRVFDKMPCHTVVSWNALMLGYAENGQGELALGLVARMRAEGCAPNRLSFVAALQACTSLALKEEGKQVDGMLVKVGSLEKGLTVHSQAASSGCDSDIFVGNTLVDMYAKCGSMVDAHRVFDEMPCHTVVSWNALMLGYAENGQEELALELFAHMQPEGCAPDARTFVAALKSCTSLAVKEEGKQLDGKLVKMGSLDKGLAVHFQALSCGCDSDSYVASSLVDMYAKCGSMVNARRVFDRMRSHNVVCWNALMFGYVENGQGALALELFARMRPEGCAPNRLTFVAALKACGMVVALEIGKAIHADICFGVLENDALLATSLVDFYGKCGSMVDAQQVFDSIVTKDFVTWTALIAGYSRQGDTKRVFDVFQRMQDEGLRADGITLLCILTACSHAGLVDKGKEYFEAMYSKYGVNPGIEHYVCMVDILGRANQVDDAVTMVKSMPFKPDAVAWTTVLGACRKWSNVVLGRVAFESLLRLDEKDATAYVLMANIYGSRGMWEEQSKVEAMRVKAGAWKKIGQSCWTDQAGVVHTFVVGDATHPQSKDIYTKLKHVLVKMKEQGYTADMGSIVRNLSEDAKESALCGHSERLAIACALINTAPGTTIRIIKNLRVCEDCHVATALISKIEQRCIICRDSSRFHVFKDGKCSCGDFW